MRRRAARGVKMTIDELIAEVGRDDYAGSFKSDLLGALGLAEHPKARELYRLAWDYGHSAGYQDVVHYALDMAELLRP